MDSSNHAMSSKNKHLNTASSPEAPLAVEAGMTLLLLELLFVRALAATTQWSPELEEMYGRTK